MSFENEARSCEPPALLYIVLGLCLGLQKEHDFFEETAWLAHITISSHLRRMFLVRGYSSAFVSKAMARLVEPIDPKDPERHPVDLTIKCGTLDVQAHSHVLCQESSYFKAICKGGFLEEYTQELNLPAEEEFLIRRLLCYLYTTGYNDEPYHDENDPPPQIEAPPYVNRLDLDAQMYNAADKYDIPSLKEKAAEKFDTAIREMLANKSKNLRTGASLVDEVIEAIPTVYATTPDEDHRLRGRVVKVVLVNRREFQAHPGLKDLMAVVPEFFEERYIRSFDSLRR